MRASKTVASYNGTLEMVSAVLKPVVVTMACRMEDAFQPELGHATSPSGTTKKEQ
jgi:hypothetical protein